MSQSLAPASCNVYTPQSLADALVEALGDTKTARWLEPCVGKGALLKAIVRNGTTKERIVGLDLDGEPQPSDKLGRVRRGTEFLDWAFRTTSRFDRIIANPPYISLRKLPTTIRKAALLHQTPRGETIPASANCWYAFLCACLHLLRPGGSLGFVLPASFEYAGYADQLRKELPELFGEFRVLRCQHPIFDEVDEGVVVLLCLGRGKASIARTRIECKTLHSMIANLKSRRRRSGDARPTSSRSTRKHVRLGDVMNIGIGAVTGDADYFLLNESQRLRHRLPKSVLHPVVSRARHIRTSSITNDVWDNYRSDDERVWLFRPRMSDLDEANVRAYINLPPEHGGCRRQAFKIRHRSPWWMTHLPVAPHAFLSGMSQFGPVLCFNDKSRLTATNTLYTVRFAPHIPEDQRYAWALMLLTTSAQSQIAAAYRTYALGLKKLEPSDICRLELPVPHDVVTLNAYDDSVGAIMKGNWRKASRIANAFIATAK